MRSSDQKKSSTFKGKAQCTFLGKSARVKIVELIISIKMRPK